MRKTRTISFAVLVLLAALASALGLAAQQRQEAKPSRYTIADLGTLGGTYSEAVGINNRGALAGYSTLPGDAARHAFVWQNNVMTDLGTLGGLNSVAPESAPQPNDIGEVAGTSETSTLDPNAENFCSFFAFFNSPYTCLPFVWRNGVMSPLPLLGGNNGTAWQVNNLGQVTGTAENATADPSCPTFELESKPVIWEGGAVQELPTVAGDLDGAAFAINGYGQAVGFAGNCTSGSPFTTFHAVFWQRSAYGWTATDLGNLGGKILNLAFGINNRGQVVGQSDLPGDTAFHAFLWQKGVMTDLGTLPGDVVSWAATINNKDQAVGTSFDASSNMHPYVWQNGIMTDLNTLIPSGSPWYLLEALGNNDLGQIVGYGFLTTTGEVHAYVATPCGVAPPSAEGCGDSAGTASDALSNTTERPRVILPDNVRNLLRRRHGFPH